MFCFAKFCRLCLKDSSVLINIFCIDKDNEKIVDKIKFLLPELISPLDGFPPWVCLSCRTQVNRTFNLFKKWIKSHETLQKYIRKYKVTNQVPNNTVINVQLIGINFKLNNIEKSINTDYKTVIENEDKCEDLNQLDHEDYKEIDSTDNLDSFKNIDNEINNKNNKLFKEEASKNDIDNNTIVSEETESLIEYDEQLDDKNYLFDVSETPLKRKTEDITSGNIKVHYDVPKDNIIPIIETDNKVIEEILKIVKLTDNIDQKQQIPNKENTSASCSDEPVGIDQLIEISTDGQHVISTKSSENIINIVNPITHILKQNEEQNIVAVQEFSNNNTEILLNSKSSSIAKNNLKSEENLNNIYLNSLVQPTTQHNILDKPIINAKITESNEDLPLSIPVSKEHTSEVLINNLGYISETGNQICTTSFSETSNNLHYKLYSANYYNNNSNLNNNNFQQNYIDNNFQYANDNYSIEIDEVKKISGYLQESYHGSPSNVYCNLDDKMYYNNCDMSVSNILDNTTNNSSVCSPNSDLNNEVLSFRNVVENKYMSTFQTYCTYSNEELNYKSSDVETLSVNNFNQDVLTKENFKLLENVEKNLETVANLESLIIKNVTMQNQVPHNYATCYGNQNNTTNELRETNIPYTGNFALGCNIYNREYTPPVSVNNSIFTSQYNNMHYNEIREDYSPTLKKDCFTFSEDSNGNEIPCKKTKIPRKRNKTANNKENKFFQVFQDMEIASRHCNTPIEFTVSLEDIQITYLIERNKSLYCCTTCNVTYENIAQILDHGTSLHSSSHDFMENEYLSINVEKPDKSVKLIVNHEKKKFICKKCDKNFGEVAALYRHVAVHVSNQRYFCEECGKSFPVYRYLSLHKLIHSRIRVYACKLCPKTFRAKDTLRTHEIVHHEANQNKPFICEICGKGFVIDQYLKIHMKRHNKETGRICHICGKILKNEELCYKHIKEKHLVVNLKECEICHKTFHANRNLKAHMKLHGTRDFKCDQCEKEFFFKRDLVNHQHLHSGFRPHICHYCGKDFRSLGALYKHMRTHTKIKPHICGICQKAFSQLSSLQAHERVHSGYKPYKCQKCGKGYVQSNVFQQHMKKVHPGEII